ncbi:hypothetical protein PN462_18475 [Spirulina sp. CS-785/01]|uniref:hypothetical protein n=1 Tax=Spirulina sp. CS-785/01 TaxID=3021716 RepID=UPI00232F45EC|nr:hypothetical protein [Spirulina sp. CS-785/01]MDB9315107.1 hypothetical protein [Spirulina sp. CS-785/01]
MSKDTANPTKTQILQAFQQVLAKQEQISSKVATKEEEARKVKNQELLETVADYTLDSIVNGMAALQLDFGNILTNLSERLDTESNKLEELKRAISVETENLQNLRQVRVVADALYILRQEHEEKLQGLEKQTQQQQETLEKEQIQTRKFWDREAEEFAAQVAEMTDLITKQREQEAADYQYETERARKVEMDEYEEQKRLQERTLQEQNQFKEKNWTEREQKLAEQEAEFEANQEQITGFEEALKAAYTQAKEAAISEANREATVKANLVEKEWEAEKQGYDLKLQSLEASIQRQTEQISDLMAQLQAATNQAQSLAMRAFQGNNSNK